MKEKQKKENTVSKLPPEFRGKFVSRSAFAKMQNEKQRLEKDIYNLVFPKTDAAFSALVSKYRKHFRRYEWLTEILIAAHKNKKQ